jgi:hypothetical protein
MAVGMCQRGVETGRDMNNIGSGRRLCEMGHYWDCFQDARGRGGLVGRKRSSNRTSVFLELLIELRDLGEFGGVE